MRLGGIGFVTAGVLYVILLVMLTSSGGEASSAQGLLTKVTSYSPLIHGVGILFLAMYLCLVVAFPALFVALKDSDKSTALIATILALVAFAFDFVSSLIVYALPFLANFYNAAEGTLQSSFGIATEFIFSYVWKIETPVHVALASLGIAMFGFAMLKSNLGKYNAYAGMTIGSVGFIGGLLGFFPIAFLWPAWFIPVGVRLYRKAAI